MPSFAPTTVNVPSDFLNAGINFNVDIYPHEVYVSSPVTLHGSQTGILSASIVKNIRNRTGGEFILSLAPGGPNGVNSNPTWTQIITPSSLAVIYLQRGASKRIFMIGIVTKIEETEIWTSGKVQRVINLYGVDFTYYFSVMSYYEMMYFGLLQSNQFSGVAGFIFGEFGGTFSGPPVTEAWQWLTLVMLGVGNTTSPAVLEQTYVTYKNSKIFIKDLFGYWFEPFNEAGQTAYFPLFTDLMNSEGSWMDKLLSILTWPYYEFFIDTVTDSDFPIIPQIQGINSPSTGYAKSPAQKIFLSGYNSAYPVVIGRVNPLPWISIDASQNIQYHHTRWDALPIYDYSKTGFITSKLYFSMEEVANFFSLNTTDSRTLAQTAGVANPQLFAINMLGAMYDQNSINNYGYRPQFANTRWLTSIKPNSTTGPAVNLTYMSAVLIGKHASYYEPTPYMMKGEIQIPMWPDIRPGNRFVCNPFKAPINDPYGQYMFYIESVNHQYAFGGASTTTLEVTRGLPKIEYDNPDLMKQLHAGQVEKINGKLQLRTAASLKSSPGLIFVNPSIIANVNIAESPYNIAKAIYPGGSTK